MLFVLLVSSVVVFRNKGAIRTPVTMPMFLFWIIGAVATLHGILIIFPETANVFANVAFLSYLRRIEYMSVFFIAYWSMKDKSLLHYVVIALTITISAVVVYGFGQKFFGFPAFLTMNEEFAKGIPIRLSALSRVSSTFAGHYDLAAYLVFIIPIMVSLLFGYRNLLAKALFFIVSVFGTLLLFMTVSRISFFALFISLGLVIFFQKKKLALLMLPVVAIGTLVFLGFFPSLLARFGSTVKEVNVLVDAQTGNPIAHVEEVSRQYFENKVIRQQFSRDTRNLDQYASSSASVIVPYTNIREKVILLTEPNAPTGEDLPQGTGYINLPLSPVTHKEGNIYFEKKPDPKTGTINVYIINGDFLIKKAFAYDLSFTTRFQGEWPRTLAAFKRNILIGSGYGSVSLAVDNSYLRMLGEVGALGFIAFFSIIIVTGFLIRKALPAIDSQPARSFILGFVAGFAGLSVNALFIDVFEASKVAFVLWILIGVVLGLLELYKHVSLDVYHELKRIATSTYAVIIYLLIAAILLYSFLTSNYFVGDDFTWFRWAASCENQFRCMVRYFTQSDGFFYRPGAKIYFLFMYRTFWLNQTSYHMVSLFLHFAVSVLVLLITRKIFRNGLLAVLAAFLFLMLSGFSEAIFWISATGFLFTSFFTLSSLLFFILWREKKQTIYFVATLGTGILSLLFHELGIITPLFYLLYLWFSGEDVNLRRIWKHDYFRIFAVPVPVYLVMRLIAGSHWLSGDYNYNLLKLPFNIVGNFIGYTLLSLVGPLSIPIYQILRNILRGQLLVALIIVPVVLWALLFIYRKLSKIIRKSDMRVLLFGAGFSLIALLPFLGLGNITSRYGYLSSVGIIILMIFILHKLYELLLSNGKDIAIAGIAIAIFIFSLSQITQLQRIHSDWHEAGEKVRRFFISVESVYVEPWKTEKLEFHFVNVPIRFGEAWVFPVGLPDALWFVFRNPNIKVFIWPSLTQAFQAVTYDSKTQKVFVFEGDGTVTETKRPLNIQ